MYVIYLLFYVLFMPPDMLYSIPCLYRLANIKSVVCLFQKVNKVIIMFTNAILIAGMYFCTSCTLHSINDYYMLQYNASF